MYRNNGVRADVVTISYHGAEKHIPRWQVTDALACFNIFDSVLFRAMFALEPRNRPPSISANYGKIRHTHKVESMLV